MALGWVSDPTRKLNPGNARLMKALATAPAAAAAGADVDWVLRSEPWSGLNPRLWLVR